MSGEGGQIVAAAASLLALSALVGLVAAARALRGRADPVLRRLRPSQAPQAVQAPAPLAEVGKSLARRLASVAQISSDKEETVSQLRRRLVQAGLRR
jgi:hypothetical protein